MLQIEDRVYGFEKKSEELQSAIDTILKLVEHLDGRELETIKKMLFELKGKEGLLRSDYRIITESPIAYESPDHIEPRGTKNDNSIWYGFNEKLYAFMTGRFPLRVMDLGCAGGGFVESLLEDGHDAVGVEGSDYSLRHRRAAWRIVPDRLFTCDITKPFIITRGNEVNPAQFEVITAWELMEHFKEESLPQVFKNIDCHLVSDGYFICSVATSEDFDRETGTIYHQTVKPKYWWEELFKHFGFVRVEQKVIEKGAWLRGSHRGDWLGDESRGFHIVLKKAGS